jgi:hypothetical protein
MNAWPSDFPCAQISGWNEAVDTAVVGLSPATLPPDYARMNKRFMHETTVSWIVSQAELQVVQPWLNAEGYTWFSMPLPGWKAGVNSLIVRLIDDLQLSVVRTETGLHWRISTRLEYQPINSEKVDPLNPAYLWQPTSVNLKNNIGDGVTFSGGNQVLKWVSPSNSGTFFYDYLVTPISGKKYCEFTPLDYSTPAHISYGVHEDGSTLFYNTKEGVAIFSGQVGCGLVANGYYAKAGLNPGVTPKFGSGDRIGIAVDAATRKVWFSKNGVWLTGDPATGVNPLAIVGGTLPLYYEASSYVCNTTTAARHVVYPRGSGQQYAAPAGFSPYHP